MEKVQWKVEGMTCANCALTIHKFLEKEGLKEVKVNAIGGDVSFEMNGGITKDQIAQGIEHLGYSVAGNETAAKGKINFLSTTSQKLLFCLPFTALLMVNMI